MDISKDILKPRKTRHNPKARNLQGLKTAFDFFYDLSIRKQKNFYFPFLARS